MVENKIYKELFLKRLAFIDLHKEELNFSAGHFTIFSATEREHLHGHNYNLQVTLEAEISETGLAFDYRFYNKKLQTLCDELNLRFLLPANSKYLSIEEQDGMVFAHFNQEKIPFLKRDVLILPIANVTIEELSYWFLQQILQHKKDLEEHRIQSITVKVSNGPGQSGAAHWKVNS